MEDGAIIAIIGGVPPLEEVTENGFCKCNKPENKILEPFVKVDALAERFQPEPVPVKSLIVIGLSEADFT